MPRRKTPKLLTRLNLSKGKITECLEVVDMHREILTEQGLHPRQVKARKIHFQTAKYNRLGREMLRHYTRKISIHNAEIEKANRILIDFLEIDSLGEVELKRNKGGIYARRQAKRRKKRTSTANATHRREVRQGTKTYAKHQDRAVRSHERSYYTKNSQNESEDRN